MKTKIKKWGNSLALRLPKTSIELLGLKENSSVVFDYDKNRIIIKPDQKREYTLNNLVSKITPNNKHKTVDWGKPVGKELW